MKRLLLLIPLILLLLLTACGKKDPFLTSEYDGAIDADDGYDRYIADVVCTGDRLSLAFRSPESVAGLRYDFRGDELHTSLGDLDCITSTDSLPPDSVPAILAAVFLHGDEAEYRSSEDGKDTFVIDRGCAVTVSADGGVPETVTSGNRTIRCR